MDGPVVESASSTTGYAGGSGHSRPALTPTAIPVLGDGNCFYYAVIACMFLNPASKSTVHLRPRDLLEGLAASSSAPAPNNVEATAAEFRRRYAARVLEGSRYDERNRDVYLPVRPVVAFMRRAMYEIVKKQKLEIFGADFEDEDATDERILRNGESTFGEEIQMLMLELARRHRVALVVVGDHATLVHHGPARYRYAMAVRHHGSASGGHFEPIAFRTAAGTNDRFIATVSRVRGTPMDPEDIAESDHWERYRRARSADAPPSRAAGGGPVIADTAGARPWGFSTGGPLGRELSSSITGILAASCIATLAIFASYL